MGFFSGLGKVLGGIGGVAAAPFTGGASLAPILAGAGSIASGIGDLASRGAADRAAGRAQETVLLSDRDRNRILADRAFEDSLLNRAGLDLDQRRFQEEVPNTRLGRTRELDRIRNFDRRAGAFSTSPHTTNLNGREITVPRFNVDFSRFGPSAETTGLADLIAKRDLERQGAGDLFAALPPLEKTQLSDMPQSSGFDTFLNTVGGIGGTLGALGEFAKEQAEGDKKDEKRRSGVLLKPTDIPIGTGRR